MEKKVLLANLLSRKEAAISELNEENARRDEAGKKREIAFSVYNANFKNAVNFPTLQIIRDEANKKRSEIYEIENFLSKQLLRPSPRKERRKLLAEKKKAKITLEILSSELDEIISRAELAYNIVENEPGVMLGLELVRNYDKDIDYSILPNLNKEIPALNDLISIYERII